jgi:hypothetical protein
MGSAARNTVRADSPPQRRVPPRRFILGRSAATRPGMVMDFQRRGLRITGPAFA